MPDYLLLRPDVTAAETEGRLARGQRCVLVRHDGVPVAARWFATERAEVDYLDLVFDLPDGVVYVYDHYHAPHTRGLDLSAAIRSFNVAILIEEGRHTLLAAVMPENRAGRGLVAQGGYRAVGWIGCLRLGAARAPMRRCPSAYLGEAWRIPRG